MDRSRVHQRIGIEDGARHPPGDTSSRGGRRTFIEHRDVHRPKGTTGGSSLGRASSSRLRMCWGLPCTAMLGPGALLTSVLVASGCRNEPPADPLDSPDGTSGVELPQADSEDAPSDDGKTRLDAGGPVPGAPPGIDCGDSSRGNDAETFQHIWIANSSQGTVSKIDTESGEELGRYLTGPGNDDPSRTSVGLDGDVVVANRAGGIVKIYAETADCADEQGQRQTSSGPQEILEWGTDTCVAWHVALPGAGGDPPNHQGPRPVAWDVGPDPCLLGDERVWVGWYD